MIFARLLLLIAFYSIPSTLHAQATENHEGSLQKWPEELKDILRQGLDQGGMALSQAIFDAIDQVNLYNGTIKDRVRIGVGIERAVFDNNDLMRTWTVRDQLSVNVGIPLYELTGSIPNPTYIDFGFSLGGQLGFQIEHIRQVASNRYGDIRPIEEIQNEIELSDWYRWSKNPPEESIYREPIDPTIRPRLGRIYNPITLPFRLPVTLNAIERMKEGDIVGFSGSGSIETGARIGVRIPSIPKFEAGAFSVGVHLFLMGEYRIHVLKENSGWVSVKITRLNEKGAGTEVGLRSGAQNIYKGFTILKKTKVKKDINLPEFKIIPFQWNFDTKHIVQFDVGYRYNLNDPVGRAAYFKAIRGRLKESEEAASEGTSVQPLFRRHTITDQRGITRKTELEVLVKVQGRRFDEISETFLELPDGKHHLFKAVVEDSHEWKSVLGFFEKSTYRHTLIQEQANLVLRSEANLEDTNTRTKEMRGYTNRIELLFNQPNLFPEIPLFSPGTRKKIPLGRSSFQFGTTLNATQMNRFLTKNESERWDTLESAFGVDPGDWSTQGNRNRFQMKHRFFHWINILFSFTEAHIRSGSILPTANKMEKRWATAQRMIDPRDRLTALIKLLHAERFYGFESMRLLTLAQEGDVLDYWVNANNRAFGQIQARGPVTIDIDRIFRLAEEQMSIEQRIRRGLIDSTAQLSNYTIDVLRNGNVVIRWVSLERPSLLYFRIARSTRFKGYRTLGETMSGDTQRFRHGLNELILDRKSKDPLVRDLVQKLTAGDFYQFYLAYSRDGMKWGPVSSARFYLR